MELTHWLNEHHNIKHVWYVKRLSANDTGASGGHQAGIYLPRQTMFSLFPSVYHPAAHNPDKFFEIHIDSHSMPPRDVRAIWYNNKVSGVGTRNETRITQWGGRQSPLQDHENTGGLMVLAFFQPDSAKDSEGCRIWICSGPDEEREVEALVGDVDPGEGGVYNPEGGLDFGEGGCALAEGEMNPAWLETFPSGAEIIEMAFERLPLSVGAVDDCLIKRRECEYDLFLSIEQAVVFPKIKEGFVSVSDFIALASSVMNRRKSRSGRSLELHLIRIFEELGLQADKDYAYNKPSEPGKKPDFLFPNSEAYSDLDFSTNQLNMLGVKTSCKDRWRQILNEADRIPLKHLFTLQEGVSLNQFREMEEAGVRLVVPAPLHKKYPKIIRPKLMTLQNFIIRRKVQKDFGYKGKAFME